MREFGPPFPDLIPEGVPEGPFKGEDDGSIEPDCLAKFLEWLWEFQPLGQQEPSAFVGVWPGNKSFFDVAKIAEMAIVALGATGRRKFCLCVSQTRERARERVGNIKQIFESHVFAANYPDLAGPTRRRNGRQVDWNRNRLQCESDFIVQGSGFAQANRSFNVGGRRPDLVLLENIPFPLGNADEIKARFGGTLAGAGQNPGYIVLHDSSVGYGLADALADEVLTGFHSSRVVSRCD